jgi:hypothetical protein
VPFIEAVVADGTLGAGALADAGLLTAAFVAPTCVAPAFEVAAFGAPGTGANRLTVAPAETGVGRVFAAAPALIGLPTTGFTNAALFAGIGAAVTAALRALATAGVPPFPSMPGFVGLPRAGGFMPALPPWSRSTAATSRLASASHPKPGFRPRLPNASLPSYCNDDTNRVLCHVLRESWITVVRDRR